MDLNKVDCENLTKNSIKCDVCGKILKHKKNLKKHMSTVHNESEKTLSCHICDKQFYFNFNLKRHLKTHDKDFYECCECFTKFKSENSLKLHLKKEYLDKSLTTSFKKCPLCEFSGSKKIILEHFTTKHDILVEKEELYFSSMDDFLSWKGSVENATTAHFVLQCRERVKADGTVLRKYECHRSGLFKSKGKQKRNSKRILGSNKINAYCPAEIIMTNKSGLIEVSFTKTHIGHTLDLCRINLSKAERDEIARKIALQIPFDRILSEVRSNISSEKLSRIHLLNKKDLFNIQKAYNIKREVKKEKKDKKRKRKTVDDSKNTITRISSNDLILNENYEFADVVFETIDIETAQNDLSGRDSTPILHENIQTWNSESEALIEGKKQAIEETYGLICLIDKIKNMEELNNFLNLIKPIKTILEANTSNL